MDYVSSGFSFDQSTGELIQFSSISYQGSTDQEDELLYACYLNAKKSTAKMQDFSRRRKAPTTTFGCDDKNPNNENKKKKMIHRDIERKRRQEMASLYGSLRSLLPLQNLKGKRSISDHMEEAVNYIKQLQEKIEELKDKRDGLKKLSNSNTINVVAPGCWQISCPGNSVIVKPCWGGVEVLVSTDLSRALPLSRVAEILIQEGLNIVNSISTQVNQRFFHSIESEVNDGRSIDLSELQQKLEGLII